MAIVLRAKTAGFCMGVGLALRKLDQALKEHRARSSGRLVMLGPIIHNPQVMNTYMQQGVVLAHSLDAVQPGDTVIIRAHGIPREDEVRLLDLGRMSLTRHALKSSRRSSPSTRPPGRGLLSTCSARPNIRKCRGSSPMPTAHASCLGA